jgi:hypothetical protein
VNFSMRKYLTGLNVMKRTKRGCKNFGTVHWTKTRKKQRQLQGLYVGTYPCPALHLTFHYLRVQLLCSHYEIEMQGQMQRRSNNDSSSCLWLYYLFIIRMRLQTPSAHGKRFFIGCSHWKRSEQGKHLYWPMPLNIDEAVLQFVLDNDGHLPNGPQSLNETCFLTAHPRIGLNNCCMSFKAQSNCLALTL